MCSKNFRVFCRIKEALVSADVDDVQPANNDAVVVVVVVVFYHTHQDDQGCIEWDDHEVLGIML